MSTTAISVLADRESVLKRQAESIRSELENLVAVDEPTEQQSRPHGRTRGEASRLAGQLDEVHALRQDELRDYVATLPPSHFVSGDGARVDPSSRGDEACAGIRGRTTRGRASPSASFAYRAPVRACERSTAISDEMTGIVDQLLNDPSDTAERRCPVDDRPRRPAVSVRVPKYAHAAQTVVACVFSMRSERQRSSTVDGHEALSE